MLALSNFMRRVLSGVIKPGVPRAMTTNAWRQESETPSLSEVFRTIAVGNGGTSRFRRFLAFIGPGYLVAVGYMDPGNWATSLAGGAAFGYTLLFVALLSNIMAILGLRALYFALDAILHRFAYLKYALSVLLIFIGSKIFIADALGWEKFPPEWSLGITFLILGVGVAYSLWKTGPSKAVEAKNPAE